jgi:hypothetical protein
VIESDKRDAGVVCGVFRHTHHDGLRQPVGHRQGRHRLIGHEGSVRLSVCKVHISATRWRLFTLTAVALRFCRATEKTPSSGGNKRRATTKSLNDLP